MAAVAEGFVVRLAAAAETNHGAAGQIKRLAVGIEDGELALHQERSVVAYCDLRGRHLLDLYAAFLMGSSVVASAELLYSARRSFLSTQMIGHAGSISVLLAFMRADMGN